MATHSRTTRDPSRSQGAYSAGGGERRRKRGGWLWWLLGLLALLIAAALLLGLLAGDDDAGNQAAQPTPSADAVAPSQAGAGAAAGSLTAGNESLLPVPAGGLAAYESVKASGRQVAVQSVVKDEGFWVGTSEQDRVYVEYGGDVGVDENQGFEPAVGDKVNLSGELRPAPENPGRTLNLVGQDARQVSEQGAYVNADAVEVQ